MRNKLRRTTLPTLPLYARNDTGNDPRWSYIAHALRRSLTLPTRPFSRFDYRISIPSLLFPSETELTNPAPRPRPRVHMIRSLSPVRCTAWATLPTSLPLYCPRLLSVCPLPLLLSPSTWLLLLPLASAHLSQAKAHGPPSTSFSYPCSTANS